MLLLSSVSMVEWFEFLLKQSLPGAATVKVMGASLLSDERVEDNALHYVPGHCKFDTFPSKVVVAMVELQCWLLDETVTASFDCDCLICMVL